MIPSARLIKIILPVMILHIFLFPAGAGEKYTITRDYRINEIRCAGYPVHLEPSGVTMYRGRLVFISDNNNDRALYECRFNNGRCEAYLFLPFDKLSLKNISKKHTWDLEGIVYMNNYFYLVDERDRNIYRLSTEGVLSVLSHDVNDYAYRHNITFSSDSNAGFEGIAHDPEKNIFFIANERQDAAVYLLRESGNSRCLVTVNHIDLSLLLDGERTDMSGLFFDKGFLYAVYRRKRVIIKLEPYSKKIYGLLDYSRAIKGLYISIMGYGFVEGIHMTRKKIFLVLDSNGQKFFRIHGGQNGSVIIFPRPAGF